MKHTIKIDTAKSIVIETIESGPGAVVSLVLFGASLASAYLDKDQCQALILALEIAVERPA